MEMGNERLCEIRGGELVEDKRRRRREKSEARGSEVVCNRQGKGREEEEKLGMGQEGMRETNGVMIYQKVVFEQRAKKNVF